MPFGNGPANTCLSSLSSVATGDRTPISRTRSEISTAAVIIGDYIKWIDMKIIHTRKFGAVFLVWNRNPKTCRICHIEMHLGGGGFKSETPQFLICRCHETRLIISWMLHKTLICVVQYFMKILKITFILCAPTYFNLKITKQSKYALVTKVFVKLVYE